MEDDNIKRNARERNRYNKIATTFPTVAGQPMLAMRGSDIYCVCKHDGIEVVRSESHKERHCFRNHPNLDFEERCHGDKVQFSAQKDDAKFERDWPNHPSEPKPLWRQAFHKLFGWKAWRDSAEVRQSLRGEFNNHVKYCKRKGIPYEDVDQRPFTTTVP